MFFELQDRMEDFSRCGPGARERRIACGHAAGFAQAVNAGTHRNEEHHIFSIGREHRKPSFVSSSPEIGPINSRDSGILNYAKMLLNHLFIVKKIFTYLIVPRGNFFLVRSNARSSKAVTPYPNASGLTQPDGQSAVCPALSGG